MNIHYHFLKVGLLGVGLSCGSISIADEKPAEEEKPEIKIFEQLDKDQNGKLTAEEVSDEKKRFFEQLIRDADANKDGVLDREEYLNPPKAKPAVTLPDGEGRPGAGGKPMRDLGQIFERADKNGDGKVSAEELPEKLAARLKPLMEKAGKDELTREDLEKLMARREGGQPKKAPKGGPPQPGKGRPSPEKLFEDADEDGDGKVYLKDVTDRGRAVLERVYDRLEKDPEEAITLEELIEAMPGPPGGSEGRPGRGPEESEMMAEREGRRPMGPPPPKFLILLDEDDDGQISKEELEGLKDLFSELDEDEDGFLSHREILGPPPHERDGMEGPVEDMPRQAWKMKKGGKKPRPPIEKPEE